jgi:hypothetical protein
MAFDQSIYAPDAGSSPRKPGSLAEVATEDEQINSVIP